MFTLMKCLIGIHTDLDDNFCCTAHLILDVKLAARAHMKCLSRMGYS